MWYDGCEHYGGVGVSEKVVRTTIADMGDGFFDVNDVFMGEWKAGDEVVVIPANVYDFLKQAEALVANGVVLDTDEYVRLKRVETAWLHVLPCAKKALATADPMPNDVAQYLADGFAGEPRKRCMNCDGNNVNAPCTCEGV